MHKGSGRGTEARSSMYSTQIGTCCRCHGNAEQVMDFLERDRKLFFVLIWTTPYRRAEEPHRCIYWSLITATVSTRRSKVCPHLHKRLKSSDSNMFYSSSSVTNVAWSHTPTHVRWDTHDQIQCNCFLLLTFSTSLPLSRECHAMQRTHTHTYISTHTLCDVYFISFLDILCSL